MSMQRLMLWGRAARADLAGARPATVVGAAFVVIFLLAALLGPVLAPHPPLAQDLDHVLAGPSPGYLFGTDENGSDLLSMLLHGARLALLTAGSTVAICFVIGAIVGATAGYFGG